MKPLVSICIPTFNGARFISDALDSILEQSYSNLEVVISDDSSEDNTLEIVKEYEVKSTFPIRIHNHNSRGIGANWNNCIKYSQGEYIKFLFQDDVLKPKCVEKMVSVLTANDKIALVGSKREFIVSYENQNAEFENWLRKFRDLQKDITYFKSNDDDKMVLDKFLFKSPDFLKTPLNKIGEPSTFMFRKDILKEVGLFREDLKQVLDYEFCYRILRKRQIAIINDSLCKFRLHENQATQKNKENDSSDYKIYFGLIERDYFWLLNLKKQVEILRKNYKVFDALFILKSKIFS